MKIRVGARNSPLSQAQVEEVYQAFVKHHPNVVFETVFLETTGDLDLTTSLMKMERSNFFTKELDELLSQGKIQVAIHSAKDLPDPLHPELTVAALTQGVDPSDVLVLREGQSVESLRQNAAIGTSSTRRIHALKALREDLVPVDIRGKIERRLSLLDEGTVDGVILAEAALIRLRLTHRNRITLKGEIAPLQGKLAVLTRILDLEVQKYFSCLDSRSFYS